jgi:hypothetical protein
VVAISILVAVLYSKKRRTQGFADAKSRLSI